MKNLLLLLLLLLCGCEVDNQYSSTYCNFMFQASLYPTSALTNAIASSGGNFCIVKAVQEKGVWHLKLTPNQGSFAASDLDLTMTTAIGNERINYNAMGRKRGLIIGRTYSGVLCAYDLLCPNCDFNSELKWADAPQELRCNKCKRVYSIYSEYSIVKTGEEGHTLEQYKRVSYNPERGILSVQNP